MRPHAFVVAVALACASSGALAGPPAESAQRAYRAGQAALEREDFALAEQRFRSAIKEEPLFSLAHYGLGTVFASTRRYPEALEAFTQAIAAHRDWLAQRPGDAALLDRARDEEIKELRDTIQAIQSGRVRFKGPTDVIKLEQRVVRLEQDKAREQAVPKGSVPAELYVALGSAHHRLGHLEEARVAYEEALRIDPARGDAHNNLAVIALVAGEKDKAATHVGQAEASGFRVNPDLKRDLGMDVAEAGTLRIEHQPLTCAAEGRNPLIEARAVGTAAPAQLRVRFLSRDSPYWYAVRMNAEGDRFVARLPRPAAGLRSFNYRIDATDGQAASASSELVTVPIRPLAECPGDPGPPPRTALLIEVPASAPRKPPVPEGFSAEGVKGTGGTSVGWLSVPAKLGAAIGVGAVAGIALGGSKSLYDENPTNPRPEPVPVDLVSLMPAPGATLVSPSQQVQATFRVTLPSPAQGVAMQVDLEDNRGFPCIQLNQNVGAVAAGSAFEITVFGPAEASQFCAASFDVRGLRLWLRANGEALIPSRFFEAHFTVVRATGS